jgi:hypothetical protein
MRDEPNHRFSWTQLLAIFLGLHAVFLLELLLDLHHARAIGGAPSLSGLWQTLEGTASMARTSASTTSRAYNVLVSLVLTSIALAIPLTANMYTPKLIDIFIKDKVNIVVLAFFVFSSAHVIWSTHATWDRGNGLTTVGGFYPRVSLWISFESMILGWSILIPYFYYAFRFLNPTNIITRVSALVTDRFARIPNDPKTTFAPVQEDLEQQILHLGNVILRALDRADRDVTLDAIHALKDVVVQYLDRKPSLPAEWFRMPDTLFIGLSKEAVQLIRDERIWVEQKCLHQLALAYNSSLAKMQDAISAISDVNRDLVLQAQARGDRAALRLGIRYFNTFIREAIKRKDVHAIFDVFHQYRDLARELFGKHDDLAVEMGRHLRYYAETARLGGLPFIYELAAYDLESMIEWAYDGGSKAGGDLLGLLRSFDALPASVMLVKAKLIAGGFFQERRLADEAAQLRAALAPTPAPLLTEALGVLQRTTDPTFWEVTDRQVNLDYVAAERRAAIAAFAASLAPTAGSASG